jgi:hypothetical protein
MRELSVIFLAILAIGFSCFMIAENHARQHTAKPTPSYCFSNKVGLGYPCRYIKHTANV